LRDLFQTDDGGWLQDAGLLGRLVAEKLERAAEAIRTEGWRWTEVAIDFPYGHTYGLRRLVGEKIPPTEEDLATQEALRAEIEQLEQAYAESDDMPEDVDRRLAEIEAVLAAFDDRPVIFEEADRVRAGAFVSIDGSGSLRVERGFVRPEDEAPVEPDAPDHDLEAGAAAIPASSEQDGVLRGEPQESADADEDDLTPISDRLMTELTAHRTLALRHALGGDPETAFLAALHVLCLKLFYRYGCDSCLEIEAKSVAFGQQAPGLSDSALARTMDDWHRAWVEQLPRETEELWDALVAFDGESRQALFAHCVSLSLNAVAEPWNKRPRALAHADRIADAVGLDMVASGWRPTVDNYLGRVTKARILQAVREAKGEAQAQLISHLKKGEMAEKAQELLAGTGWLPEPLRTRGRGLVGALGETENGVGDPETNAAIAQSAAISGEFAIDLADHQTGGEGASATQAAAAE
jgi:ParB family chromosome partitioning protein